MRSIMRAFVFVSVIAALSAPLVALEQGQTVPPPTSTQQPTPAPAQGRAGGRGGGMGTAPTQPTEAPEGRGGRGTAFRYDDRTLQNVKVDLALTDTASADSSTKRTITMMLVDGASGQIRSSGPSGTSLNVDAQPHVRSDGKIWLNFSLQYYPSIGPGDVNKGQPAVLNESMTVVLAEGKPMLVSQSADPRGDRRVSVEVTATVVK
jgi:hypothetical protein